MRKIFYVIIVIASFLAIVSLASAAFTPYSTHDFSGYLSSTALPNNAPVLSAESPSNESTGIGLKTTLSITVNDADADTMDISWYWGTTSACSNYIMTNNSVTNGTFIYSDTNNGENFSAYNTKYYWKVIANDSENTTEAIYQFTTVANSAPTQNTELPTNGSTSLDLYQTLSITVADTNGDNMNVSWYWGTTNACSNYIMTNNTVTDGTYIFSDTNNDENFSTYSEKYYWKVIVTDGNATSEEIYNFETKANIVPTIDDTNPANNSVSISENIDYIYFNITDGNGELMEYTYGYLIEGCSLQGASAGQVTDGGYSIIINTGACCPLSFNTQYSWWLNVTDGNTSTNETFYFTTRTENTPDDPASFTATADNRTKIDLSWTKGTNASHTRIEWNSAADGTWSVGDHTLLYNSTGTSTSHTGLDANTAYYYKAFSFNDSDNVWSSGVTDDTTTASNTLPTLSNDDPSNSSTGVSANYAELSIDINDADGDTFNYTIETSPPVGSTSANDQSNGTFTCTLSGMNYSEKHYWYVNVTDYYGTEYYWYEFTTAANAAPTLAVQTPENASTGISLKPQCVVWVNDTDDDNTLNVTWQTNESGSWVTYANNATQSRNTKVNYTFQEFKTASTAYWFRVFADDGTNNESAIFHFTTDANVTPVVFTKLRLLNFSGYLNIPDQAPILSNEEPSNGSIDQTGYLQLNITLTDPLGLDMDIAWSTNATATWTQTNTSVSSGSTVTQRATFANTSETTYWWNVSVNNTNGNYTNASYHFTLENYTGGNWTDYWKMTYNDLPPVTSFAAANYDNSSINLTWVTGVNATNTYIRYKKDSAPTSRTDGTFLVNATNTSFNHTGLDLGTHYYYTAWSYNSTDNLFTTSETTADNYTNPGNPSSLQDTSTAMEEIGFTWAKGTNATRTVIFVNATGVAGYPNMTNGVEKINTTGTTGTATGLERNTTYNFSAYSYNPDSGLSSAANSTDNATTESGAGNVSDLTASRFNDVQLNLTWNKGTDLDDTVIIRKIGSFPTTQTDGTEVYNGSFETYKDTGLTPATHYYYRAWSWNGEEFGAVYSSDDNITRPSPPEDFAGSIDGDDLDITWTKGTGATRTLIRNNTATYPANVTDGTLVYNNTGTSTTVAGISGIDYYRAWSWVKVDDESIYSLEVDLVWGGIEINVYKETNPSIAITNFTVFITNKDGTETYENTSQNNPFRIDVSDVPNGDDIAIIVSKEGYESRTQYWDLQENTVYNIPFYLPPSTDGGGDSGGSDYIPPTDPNDPDYDYNATQNESYAYLYLLTVLNAQDSPVQDAKIQLKRYINTTESYEYADIIYTDGNGQADTYLIPGDLYKIIINASGYEVETADYIPSDSIYTKTFRLDFDEDEQDLPDNPIECINFIGETDGENLFLNVSTLCDGTLDDIQIVVYERNDTNITLFGEDACSSGCENSTFVFTGVNQSNSYTLIIHYNHTYYGNMTLTIIVDGEDVYVPKATGNEIDNLFEGLYGKNPFGWHNIIMWVFLCIIFMYADQKDAGLILIFFGGISLLINVIISNSSFFAVLAGGVLPVLFIIVGILVLWKESNKKR